MEQNTGDKMNIRRGLLRALKWFVLLPQFNWTSWGRVQSEIELMYDDVYADRYPERFLMFCLENGKSLNFFNKQLRDARQWIGEFKAKEQQV